jgi:hypothetical protein
MARIQAISEDQQVTEWKFKSSSNSINQTVKVGIFRVADGMILLFT